MIINDWKYYNHAAVSALAPHEIPDLEPVNNGSIWKIDGSPILARWVTDYDCSEKTNWWYVVKDTPFDIMELKSNHRNKLRKGLKNFDGKKIEPEVFADEIVGVFSKAYETYEGKTATEEILKAKRREVMGWTKNVWGAFDQEGILCAYTTVTDYGTYYSMSEHKSSPEAERLGVNASVLYAMLMDLNEDIGKGKYVCNGSRSVNHETRFNDYLEEHFLFRKAYCNLHIVYKPVVRIAVKLLYPFRNVLERHDKKSIVHAVNSVLKMEALVRNEL